MPSRLFVAKPFDLKPFDRQYLAQSLSQVQCSNDKPITSAEVQWLLDDCIQVAKVTYGEDFTLQEFVEVSIELLDQHRYSRTNWSDQAVFSFSRPVAIGVLASLLLLVTAGVGIYTYQSVYALENPPKTDAEVIDELNRSTQQPLEFDQ